MITFDSTAADGTPLKRRIARSSIRSRVAATIAGFGTLAIATCVLAPLVGTTSISLMRALDPSIPFDRNVDAQIFFVARLPRVLAGALVGSTLASAGVVFQAMLRNPLATPFTLGVSAGASLPGRGEGRHAEGVVEHPGIDLAGRRGGSGVQVEVAGDVVEEGGADPEQPRRVRGSAHGGESRGHAPALVPELGEGPRGRVDGSPTPSSGLGLRRRQEDEHGPTIGGCGSATLPGVWPPCSSSTTARPARSVA